ncbi:hypothetical protein BBK36DRAFT_160476 [Trichoderma citrinoviride]|uniref:Uncharacterized protein n=1 Tax=Trichoderma citrinoviride TaxID=58853 RepID=A0A2T4BC44_9HYPO|nr:hypothetical protein BBK36DRAFT_160476 [Trichoderma citrinoviride]PTB66903.1 hypothetical protein BBK36DRAFT_160476 [Trichoderma citrinoviride]
MTQPPGKSIERIETADEYGRREKCFINHRRHPYTFQSHIPSIQSTKQVTGKDGLVAQHGLRIAALPNPRLCEDIFDQDQCHSKDLERFLQDSPSKLSLSYSGDLLKDLYVPVDELDLGSSPENDLQEYLQDVRAKRNRNPFRQWLPLAHTRTERDEGFNFPPEMERLWAQLNRELDVDKPVLSDAAKDLLSAQSKSLSMLEYKDLCTQQTNILTIIQYQYSCLDPISPPLSPVSDDAEPFIPDAGTAVIDLSSEPSTPGRSVVEDIERDLDSDPVVSSTFMTSPSTGDLPRLIQSCHSVIQDTKTEAPLVSTSSDAPTEDNPLAGVHLPLVGDGEEGAINLLEEKGQFEDAFMTLLEDRQYYANQLVSQERFDPADSTCRIPVPLLDFDIPPPEWAIGHLTAKMHFMFLRKSTPTTYELSPVSRDPRSEKSLRWAFFPPQKEHPMLNDGLMVPDDTLAKYLSEEETSHLSSRTFVSIQQDLEVFRLQEDEEIEETFSQDVEADEEQLINTQPTENPITTPSVQGNISKEMKTQSLPELNGPLRRKHDDDALRLLPRSYDTSATSILLHNFMELRGIKRPRLNTEPPAASQPRDALPPKSAREEAESNDREATLSGVAKEMLPAAVPQFELPSEKASVIVSVDLSRQILRRMESSWAPENLIDVDHSRHNTQSWPPGASRPKEVISPLSFEADISLSPSTGIIITNILKVRQRPLPGSQHLAPLRERVQKVSQKYETLIVLVSETNSQGEFMGTLAPSDTAAYADFVGFAAALGGDVDVHFVPEATGTMGSWVLAYMCRYSSQCVAALSRFLASEETPWELLLRRAGMNVFAAKVLSKTLFEQAGESGLAAFLNMPVRERVRRYGSLLGGEKVLLVTGKVLDRRWGD